MYTVLILTQNTLKPLYKQMRSYQNLRTHAAADLSMCIQISHEHCCRPHMSYEGGMA